MLVLKTDGMAEFVQCHPGPVGWQGLIKPLEVERLLTGLRDRRIDAIVSHEGVITRPVERDADLGREGRVGRIPGPVLASDGSIPKSNSGWRIWSILHRVGDLFVQTVSPPRNATFTVCPAFHRFEMLMMNPRRSPSRRDGFRDAGSCGPAGPESGAGTLHHPRFGDFASIALCPSRHGRGCARIAGPAISIAGMVSAVAATRLLGPSTLNYSFCYSYVGSSQLSA